MRSNERNLDETIKIAASPDYTDEELNQIVQSLIDLGYNTETKTYHRLSAVPLPPEIIFVLRVIAFGFFHRMGSDLYDHVKKKIIKIISKPRENGVSNVVFEWKVNGVEVTASCQSDNEEILTIFLNGLNDAYKSTVDQLTHQKLPENLKEIFIEFDGEKRTWQITGLRTDFQPFEFDADSEEWRPIQ